MKALLRRLYYRWGPPFNLLFLHLPKCAGTSADRALSRAFPPFKTVRLDPYRSRTAAELLGRGVVPYRRDLLAHELSRKGTGWYVGGHWAMDRTLLEGLDDRWRVVTLLRHPVDRWFSSFFFNRYKEEDSHYGIDMELDEYLETPEAIREGNMYVRILNGLDEAEVLRCSDAVETACRVLDGLSVVGTVEAMDSFREKVADTLGLRLKVGRRNPTPAPESALRQQVTEQIRRRVEELCQSDLRVYRHAGEEA